MDRFVIISGCSGGGKSSLLAELGTRGHATIEEPGRRIVSGAASPDDQTLPWVNGAAFARRAIELALDDRSRANELPALVFFDRGLIDACAALDHLTGEGALEALCRTHRYHRTVFMVPPWRAIFLNDAQRRHGFAEAEAEYRRLVRAYRSLGYEVVVLPTTTLQARADLILNALGH
ncbi:MAG: AAA family ATPase [Bosea sp. (in: a-proteobacteria)]